MEMGLWHVAGRLMDGPAVSATWLTKSLFFPLIMKVSRRPPATAEGVSLGSTLQFQSHDRTGSPCRWIDRSTIRMVACAVPLSIDKYLLAFLLAHWECPPNPPIPIF